MLASVLDGNASEIIARLSLAQQNGATADRFLRCLRNPHGTRVSVPRFARRKLRVCIAIAFGRLLEANAPRKCRRDVHRQNFFCKERSLSRSAREKASESVRSDSPRPTR